MAKNFTKSEAFESALAGDFLAHYWLESVGYG
jgi:hypothetical protein